MVPRLTPEVHESGDVDDGVGDRDENEDASQNIKEEEKGGEEDTKEGKTYVAIQLFGNHLKLKSNSP